MHKRNVGRGGTRDYRARILPIMAVVIGLLSASVVGAGLYIAVMVAP